VFDRVKLSINKKGEVVVHSTSMTNVREEENDTFTVHSLELSQRHDDIDQMIQDHHMAYEEDEEYKQFYVSGTSATKSDMIKRDIIQFSNAKQIIEECERILKEEFSEDDSRKLFNFRELLSWKMPDHFCSTSNANNKHFNRHRV
jgi:hypothetical protein